MSTDIKVALQLLAIAIDGAFKRASEMHMVAGDDDDVRLVGSGSRIA